MRHELDPNHKEKCRLVALVSQGRMSQEEAARKMAELDGESLLPPAVNVPEIEEDDIPF